MENKAIITIRIYIIKLIIKNFSSTPLLCFIWNSFTFSLVHFIIQTSYVDHNWGTYANWQEIVYKYALILLWIILNLSNPIFIEWVLILRLLLNRFYPYFLLHIPTYLFVQLEIGVCNKHNFKLCFIFVSRIFQLFITNLLMSLLTFWFNLFLVIIYFTFSFSKSLYFWQDFLFSNHRSRLFDVLTRLFLTELEFNAGLQSSKITWKAMTDTDKERWFVTVPTF